MIGDASDRTFDLNGWVDPAGAQWVFRYDIDFQCIGDAVHAMVIDNVRFFSSIPARWVAILAASLAVLALAGCSYIPQVSPYRMEIQQGNMVNQEMVSKLAVGMTKEQVKFILGTPLIIDPFRLDRWDYVFLRQPENKTEVEKRRIVVFFEENKLKRLEGDVVSGGVKGGAEAPAAQK